MASRFRLGRQAPTDDEVLRGLMQNPGTSAEPVAQPEVKTEPNKGMPTTTAEPPTTSAPAASGFDGSGYGTASGYLQAATKWFEPQVRAAKSEQEAKSLVQSYLESLRPELEKRGAKVGNIKNEAIFLDGREYDTFRDIGGLSEAQLLELGLPGGGQASYGGATGMGTPMGSGSSFDAVTALTQQSTYEDLLRKMQELNGPEAVDREALMALMAR